MPDFLAELLGYGYQSPRVFKPMFAVFMRIDGNAVVQNEFVVDHALYLGWKREESVFPGARKGVYGCRFPSFKT